ncbi:caspase family protein [Methylobacter sp. YRD-M1]|uniref:caspase family protein n=1 Tax=Methylobacter sp. YRD-M1 TaxID=2911520 RepID=UPI00227A2C06|nr:caspase family protein [Methylobacter sp. YRD-M1]WAK00348.1 caspase family protein [Methylobacter sp. YRD-M1]
MIVTRKITTSAACFARISGLKHFFLALFLTALIGCQTAPKTDLDSVKTTGDLVAEDTDKLFVVDCLLPEQVSGSGARKTDASSRQPTKTTAAECRARGGEYVAHDRANVESALKVWLPQAQQGNAEAQVILGEIYEKGLGGTADPAMAAQWYSKAAEQGNSRAQIDLGHLYEQGLGVKKNTRTALKWYRKGSGLANSGLQFMPVTEASGGGGKRRHGNNAQHQARAGDKASDSAADSGRKRRKAQSREKLDQLQEQLKSLEAEYHNTFARIKSDMTIIEGRASQIDSRREKFALQRVHIKLKKDKSDLMARGGQIKELKKAIEQEQQNLVSLEDVPSEMPEQSGLQNKSQEESPVKASPKSYPSVDFGRFYALIIGINDYKQLPALQTSVNDAKAVDEMLRTRYGYKTTLLVNASQHQIMTAFDDLRKELTEKDSLLIYYAGLGEIDKSGQSAYWLPSDAEPDNNANWLSSHNIVQHLSILPAKHILVIADSCYSGTMTKTSIAHLPEDASDKKREKWLKLMNSHKGRTVITSGSVKPIPDSGDNSHSVFANAFLKALGSNTGLLEDYELYRMVSGKVKQSASQIGFQQSPQYSAMQYVGHEGSPFFFVPRS